MPRRDLNDVLAVARAALGDTETARRCLPLVDLTSLRGDETAAEIGDLARRGVEAGVAALCLYTARLPDARQVLAGTPLHLAAVVNFPEGGEDITAVAVEAAAAVAEGADELDLVAPLEAVVEGDLGLLAEMVQAVRDAAPNATLKLILETGLLETPERITAAARAGVMAGVDFLKTSTGKRPQGATLEAAALLLEVSEEAGGRVGLKAAGGIRTVDDATGYLFLADTIMGADWVSPARFRLGASSLLDDILRQLSQGSDSPVGGTRY